MVIESTLKHKKTKCSRNFHNNVFDNCGDADVQTARNQKIDPSLKFYPGVPLMINSNDNIKSGRANGTLCHGVRIKLKCGVESKVLNWDGKKVFTVLAEDTEHMVCELPQESTDGSRKFFKLVPESKSAVVSLRVFGNTIKVGGVTVTQFGVNSNIATTGHKLQGMSKDNLIIVSWNHSTRNWVHVVLSRARKLSGLFLCKKLDETKDFQMDPRLKKEEERLKNIETLTMTNRTPVKGL